MRASRLSHRRSVRPALTAALSLLFAALPVAAHAQSAATMYQRAFARETTARADSATSVSALRTLARSYENISRTHPRSGYADNALWQAAGLLLLAHERSRLPRDRDQAQHLLEWLQREYPSGTLARQVDARLRAIMPPAPSAATLYEQALDHERTARADTATPVGSLRAIARSYEAIPRTHPRSGYADNALWQAAALLVLAHERSGLPRDLERARRLLEWLKREYPSGTLARQVDVRLRAMDPPASSPRNGAAPARAAASTEGPEPTVVDSSSRTPQPFPRVEPTVRATRSGVAVRSLVRSALPKGDRLTIEMSGEALYSATAATDPNRVILDFANTSAPASVAQDAPLLSGQFFKSLTLARGAADSTRLVLELVGAPRFSVFPLYGPFRLVIDIESEQALPPTAVEPVASTAPAASPDSAAPAPKAPAATSRGDYSLARQLGLGVSRIVIDPGHGGHDPGAQANGVVEANLVLDIALRLEALLLEQADTNVVLTRRTDEFVALEERTAIANREAADLFISIHANSSPRNTTRGIETFFLDFARTSYAEAVAARENASSAQPMRLLSEILESIALTNKLDESRELATIVQASLVGRLSSQNKTLTDLGIKQAPFVVLIGAQMPSVLAEVSFLTNAADATLLKQAAHRQRIAQALADAVGTYQASLKKASPSAARTAAAR